MNEQSTNREIRVAAQKLAGTYNKDELTFIDAIILSVDLDNRLCNVQPVSDTAQTELKNVRLQSVVNDGIILVPTVGSEVTVLKSIRTDAVVVQYSELDYVYIVAPKVQFNKGQLGGMVKVIDLTTKLNNLENLVNDLVLKYNAHTHVTACPAGAGTATPTPNIESQVLTPTQRTDIENKNIVQ